MFVSATPEMLEDVRDVFAAGAPGLDVDRLKERVADPDVWLIVDTTRRLAALVIYEDVELTLADGSALGPQKALHFAAVIPESITASQAREACDALLVAIRNRRPELLDLPLGGFGPRARALAIRNAYGTSFVELRSGQWAVWSTARQCIAFRGL